MADAECRLAAADEILLTRVLQHCSPGTAGLYLIHHYRAAARFRLSKYAAAAQDAGTALALEESFYPASCCYAAALASLGKHADAARVLQRALELDPANAEVRATQKWIGETRARQALQAAARTAAASLASHAHPGQPIIELQGVVDDASSRSSQQQQAAASTPGRAAQPQRSSKGVLPGGCGLDPRVYPEGLRRDAGKHLFASAPDGVNTNLLILLHGLGDTPKPYAALARRMALPQTATLALAGPLAVPETDGGRAWFQAFDDNFDLIEPSPGDMRRTRSLSESVRLLSELIQGLVEAGWLHRQIHFFGFSQGATVAIEVLLRFKGEQRLGGCVSVAGAMLEELLWERQGHKQQEAAALRCGPLLLTLGDRDATTSRASVDGTIKVASQACGPSGCRLHAVPGKGHGMIGSEGEMRAVMSFWAESLSSRPPGEDVVEIRAG